MKTLLFGTGRTSKISEIYKQGLEWAKVIVNDNIGEFNFGVREQFLVVKSKGTQIIKI